MVTRALTHEETFIYLGSTFRVDGLISRFVPVVDEEAVLVKINLKDSVIALPPEFFQVDTYARSDTLTIAIFRAFESVLGKEIVELFLEKNIAYKRQTEHIESEPTYDRLASDELVIAYSGALPTVHDESVTAGLFGRKMFELENKMLRDYSYPSRHVDLDTFFSGYRAEPQDRLSEARTMWTLTETIGFRMLNDEDLLYSFFEELTAPPTTSGDSQFMWIVPLTKPAMNFDFKDARPRELTKPAREVWSNMIPRFNAYTDYAKSNVSV